MFFPNDRWAFRKGIFLLLLLLQFYLLKRYTEPYPSINFPHFQHNFPLAEPIVVSRTEIIGIDSAGVRRDIPASTLLPYASSHILRFSWYRMARSAERTADASADWTEYFSRPMLDSVANRFSKIYLENHVVIYKDAATIMADSVGAQLTIYER